MPPEAELALLYHAHHTRHSEDIPFWLELAAQAGGPLLELGCGTGRVLLALAQAGHRVTGLDLDAVMLAALRRNWADAGLAGAPVFQADMRSFRLAQPCALILLPCNTLSTLDSPSRQAMLACAAGCLRPDGLFAASLPNPAALRRLRRRGPPDLEDAFPHPLDGEPVQVSSAWERSGQAATFYWHYDHLLPDGRVERSTASSRHSLDPLGAYLGEAQAVGLEPMGLFGDYDRTPFQPASPQAILLARRNKPV
jgi:SAM-dependent methyltransferase